jgi:CrcB protein
MNETVATLFAVALGGALGSMLRFRLRFLTKNSKISMGSLPANIIASFVLGLITALFADAFFAMEGWQAWFQPFLTVGFAGSLSTFSTLALEMHENTKKRNLATTFGYAAFTFGAGLAFFGIGLYLGTSVPV